MGYLAGPGKTNEHEEQHLIAGDSAIMAEYGHEVLDGAAALAIAKDLDRPREFFGVEVTRNKVRTDENGEAVRDSAGAIVKDRVAADVWHCSLSLAAEEGQLTDEQWGRISTDFVQRMGFAGEDIGKAECRWVAVRHGLSKNGNDHVHIAVSLVREDGTKASVHKDYERSQTISRELEREYGLQVYQAPEREFPERGVRPGARESAARRGHVEPDMQRLERAVRAASSASQDESEFVRRLRQGGVLVRPRFATGRDDVIAGYSVALRPTNGEKAIWHGGGRLARDLTLPELRKGWPDQPESASDAASEWRATAKNPWQYTPVNRGREVAEPAPELFEAYAADMDRLHDYIRSVDPSDKATWAHVARETAGAYAAWSRRMEPTPGPLADAARSLARSAHLRAHETTPRPAGMPSSSASTALILAAAGKNKNAAAELLLFRQLAKTSHAIMSAHKAAGDARRSAELSSTLQRQLTQVRDGYSTRIASVKAAEREQQWQALPDELKENRRLTQASFGSGSPVPTTLTKREQEAADQLARRARESRTQPGSDRGDRGR
ncbi:relaxase/mobilization nuclease domain-containing protein [Rathayibacter sp. VKM Ac-2760]|uniref:relaxase/mobilization nuclease domain-containing protein n=1 Tax=Rathayibacter sp. VKM Ac-2760 TaxID=2609253 RepID=UPI0013188974|nr:relaxase/mobilization nuclease domain-containing protein [Rathayibacter sp. VKM Ac-2760]QHC61212.1 relaxase/mobilization nuclease domain-containing protein [Rathayibacter sp. VKM Ac-2760]